MSDSAAADRFSRNLAAFAAAAPDIHARLQAITEPVARVVVQPDDAGDINLDLGGRLLYAGGARRQGAAEVDEYLKSPGRMTCKPPTENGMVEDVTESMRRALAGQPGSPPGSVPAAHRGAVMIVFGIGLGEPVARLLDALPLRHLVVIEPYAEILWHSLWVQDWEAWFAELGRRGGGIKVILGDDPEGMIEVLFHHLRDNCFATLDGAYLYRHYGNPTLEACWHGLLRRHAALFGSKGFFEDELRMLANTAANVARPVAIVRGDARIDHDLPAVIVAAGPSLDASLADVVRLRGAAVVFSAGTTLATLLRRDLEPDFHCEIENTPENFLALTPAAAARNLSSVRLVGSATVDPRIPPLFGESLLLLRHNTLSARLFGDNAQAIEGTTPNCINLAARMAVHLGFREIFLFGADFGSRDPDRHHVSDSIWLTDPAWRAEYDRVVGPMSIEMPANFGGKAYTNRTLQDALWSLERLIAHTAGTVRFTNCSNGVVIAGAVRKAGSQVKLAPVSASGSIARIVEAVVARHPGGALLDRVRILRFRDAFGNWRAILSADLAALQPGLHDLVDCADTINRGFAVLGEFDEGAAVRTLTEGSVMVMFHAAFHHAIHADRVEEAELLQAVVSVLIKALGRMQARLDETIAGMLPEGYQAAASAASSSATKPS